MNELRPALIPMTIFLLLVDSLLYQATLLEFTAATFAAGVAAAVITRRLLTRSGAVADDRARCSTCAIFEHISRSSEAELGN
jgi:hypothetical protein